MQLEALFQHPTWPVMQMYWEALAALPDQINQLPVGFDWDLLRVSLDRKLNHLQRLTMTQTLSPEAAQIIQSLCLQRFDQVLEHINRRRQHSHAFYNAHLEQPSPHLRYQILQEIEFQLKRLRKDSLMREKLDPLTCQHILEDLNLELLEKIAKHLNPQARTQTWPIYQMGLICLACNQLSPEASLEALLQELEAAAAQDLAIRVFQSSPFPQSLESAMKILQRQPFPSALFPTLEKHIFQTTLPASTRKMALHLLEMLSPETALAILGRFLQIPNLALDLRHTGLELLKTYAQVESPQSKTLLILLETAIAEELWPPLSLLLAVQVLTHYQIFIGFEYTIIALQTALARDYTELEEAAIDTLLVLKDARAIPFLLDALNQKREQKGTSIERYSQAFSLEQQPLETKLVWVLREFGVHLELNPLSKKWQRSIH